MYICLVGFIKNSKKVLQKCCSIKYHLYKFLKLYNFLN